MIKPLYMHEYGHTIDSKIFGLSYLFVIGAPSLYSAATSKKIDKNTSTHSFRWYEMRANRHAKKYFSNYGVIWDEIRYPTQKR